MRRILILDADAERRDKMAFLLRHMGYAVEVRQEEELASSGSLADPDLVLVGEQVLGADPRRVSTGVMTRFGSPKVVLGTDSEEVAGVPYLEMGADAYLPAPLDMRVLLARVRAFMNRCTRRDDDDDDNGRV